jgi:hypothetical protein
MSWGTGDVIDVKVRIVTLFEVGDTRRHANGRAGEGITTHATGLAFSERRIRTRHRGAR